MDAKNIPFTLVDWDTVAQTRKPGETGFVLTKAMQFPGLQVRIVEYTAGYLADHWCQKGHLIYCLEGEFITEDESGESHTLTKGMSYIVSDKLSSHRSKTETGVKLLIVDGDFLKYKE